MNKTGGVPDDVIDLILTVLFFFLLFFFVSSTIDSSIEQSQKITAHTLAEFKRVDAALNNLYVQVHEGATLDPDGLEGLIAESKVLGGKVITTCHDYITQEDCGLDTVGLQAEDEYHYCSWADGRCQALRRQQQIRR